MPLSAGRASCWQACIRFLSALQAQLPKNCLAWLFALAVPLFYLCRYTPYGMDTTDFGYFYAYAWRILQGQVPYRDFFYIKPALPLYWHAFWMWLTPGQWQILAGKAGFCLSLLASAWLGSLYLARIFKLDNIGIPLPLLATCGFIFAIHSFPHMPWHTADGVLFSAGSLYAAVACQPLIAGVLAACATGCKQSFALVPLAIAIMLWFGSSKKQCIIFCAAFALCAAGAAALLVASGAWANFRAMTTGQLAVAEALDAGIFIYLRQNWLMPLLACLPWAISRIAGAKLPAPLAPGYVYLLILTFWYLFTVIEQKTWIGFGASWPTLFLMLGGIAVLLPRQFLLPYCAAQGSALAAALALGCPLLISWSTAISGGYKIPAMFATPLAFSFLLFHKRFFGAARSLAWFLAICGLVMFGAGYEYPYVFPARPLARSEMTYNAGEVYPQAQGVFVDRDMYERLLELRQLAAKYGPRYKTLPGFPFAYYLNGDQPQIGSDWLIDWEINGKVDELYQQLVDGDITVFMERDQLDAARADAYERAGYGVPQRVRKNWRIVDETPHFVIFQKL